MPSVCLESNDFPLVYVGDYRDPQPRSVALPNHEFRQVRRAVRAVLFDERGHVCLMRATNPVFHKLPGGGMDPGETFAQALARELKEETGAAAKVIGAVGRTVQYDLDDGFVQYSYAYMAEVTQWGVPELTAEETDAGFSVVRFVTLAEARAAVLAAKLPPQGPRANRSIQFRDQAILQAAMARAS